MGSPGGADVLAAFNCRVYGKDAEEDASGRQMVKVWGREGNGGGRWIIRIRMRYRRRWGLAGVVYRGVGTIGAPWKGFFVRIKDVD